jgi:hypothetical protein
MQNIHQPMMDHEIMYADISSKKEQVLVTPLLQNTKKTEHGGQLKVEICFSGS